MTTRTPPSGVPTPPHLVLCYTCTLQSGTERTAWTVQGQTMRKAIEQDTLQALLSTQTVRELRVMRKGAGWALEGRLGGYWLPVRSRREPVRLWASLTAVGRFCESMGAQGFQVEL